jgi:uncharacterized caspase-like protein
MPFVKKIFLVLLPSLFIYTGFVFWILTTGFVCAAESADTAAIQTSPKTLLAKDLAFDSSATPGERVALVIGNAEYKVGPLRNPVNDVRDITQVLGDMGFDVIKLENANRRQIVTAADEFYQRLKNARVALFYYSGHGMQVKGRNYLIPIGIRLRSESDIEFEAVDAGRILGKMEDARAETNIIILDACRSNPFARSYRSNDAGLARMDAPKGSYIAFATAPGSVADDGTGRNGVFTEHLLKNIVIPNLDIDDIMKRTRRGVALATSDQQIPWSSSSLMGDFFFSTIAGLSQESPSPAPAPPRPQTHASIPHTAPSTGKADDIDSILKQRKAEAEKWAAWQAEMEAEFKKIDEHDQSPLLSPIDKMTIWSAFLTAYNQDNPVGSQDDMLRRHANSRLEYWSKRTFRIVTITGLQPLPPRPRNIGYDIIYDPQTSLEWVIGPNKDISIKHADEWVADLDLADGGWRMPTLKELETLYVHRDDGTVRIHPAFDSSAKYIWAQPVIEDNRKNYVAKNMTQRGSSGMSWYSNRPQAGYRVFAVREAKRSGS